MLSPDPGTNEAFSLLLSKSVANIVSPGAFGGSSSGAGIRWRAPKPRVHPRAPRPPQLFDGVMSTGRVMLYSWLYTKRRSGLSMFYYLYECVSRAKLTILCFRFHSITDQGSSAT